MVFPHTFFSQKNSRRCRPWRLFVSDFCWLLACPPAYRREGWRGDRRGQPLLLPLAESVCVCETPLLTKIIIVSLHLQKAPRQCCRWGAMSCHVLLPADRPGAVWFDRKPGPYADLWCSPQLRQEIAEVGRGSAADRCLIKSGSRRVGPDAVVHRGSPTVSLRATSVAVDGEIPGAPLGSVVSWHP